MPAFLTPPGGAAASIFGGNARPTIGAAPAGVKRMFLLRFSRPESAEVSAFARDSQRGSRVQRKLSTKLRTAIFGPGDCAAATFLTCRARRGRGCGPDRKRVVYGTRVSVRVDLGGRRTIK